MWSVEVTGYMFMNLTEKETETLKLLKVRGEISSERLKMLFGTEKGKKALTKKNFPNIRHLLYSYMTAYSHGMYRGGFQWVSVVSWKGKYGDFEKFLNDHGI